MTLVLPILAALSLALLLWQWLEAACFPLHRRRSNPDFAPGVTLLKPLKGCDAETEACLRSWLEEDYPGRVQTIFAVASAEDPVAALVLRLRADFPQSDVALVLCPERLGANSKVSKLAQVEPRAEHEVLVVSDADVYAPRDFLANLVAPLADHAVALVNPFYRLTGPSTPAMHAEALAVNADFWSSVLQAVRLGPMRFALGAAMAVRRAALRRIGGFPALVDHLADDYELGKRLAGLAVEDRPATDPRSEAATENAGRALGSGRARIELCPVVVECRESPRGWSAVWRHQIRWARTIRHCQPLPYALSLLSNPTIWPLLWLVAAPGPLAWAGFAVCVATRLGMAAHCQARLTRSWRHLPWIWLAPVKDLLGTVLWVLAFLGNTIEWRGERYRVRRGGRLEQRSRAVTF